MVTNVPSDVLQRVQVELKPGEELRWVGQPAPARLVTPPPEQTLLWGVVAVTLLPLGLMSDTLHATFMWTWGLMVALVVVGMALPLMVHYLRAQRIIYALTDRRAMIINGPDARSYFRNDIYYLDCRERRDGSGDLVFREEYRTQDKIYDPRTYTMYIGFFGIPGVHQVEILMRQTFGPVPFA